MAVSYNTLSHRILRLLGDPNGTVYTTALIHDGICHALDSILPWTPDRNFYTVTCDGVKRSFDLPDEFYEIEAVVDQEKGDIIPRAIFAPGNYFGIYMKADNAWRLSTEDKLTFAHVPASGDIYEVWYTCQWTAPEVPATVESGDPPDQSLDCPAWVDCALAFGAAAYCLMPTAIQAADVRQWNTRVDSGNPEDNPVMRVVDWLNRQFLVEMQNNPRHQKASA